MLPVSATSCNHNVASLVKLANDAGKRPERPVFKESDNHVSSVKLEREDGMLPVRLLLNNSKPIRFVNFEIEDGMFPVRAFSCRDRYLN